MAHTTLFQNLLLATSLVLPLLTSAEPNGAQARLVASNPRSAPRSADVQQTHQLSFEPKKPAPKKTRGGGRRLFEPPQGQGAPGASRGGGRRADQACPQDRSFQNQPLQTQTSRSLNQSLAPILPYDKQSKTYFKGLTLAEHPTFLVHVPKTSARKLEFALNKIESDEGIRMIIDLPKEPGILRISLPPTIEPLEIGKDYAWRVTVVCQAGGGLPGVGDPFAGGVIRRIQSSAVAPLQANQQMTLADVEKYAKAGIWYDASAGLAALKYAQPDDPALQATWEALLEDAELEALAGAQVKN